MKKLLSLLGVTAILTSAGSGVITIQALQNNNSLNLTDFKNNDIQFDNFKKEYNQLSEIEQRNIVMAMAKMPELNDNEINQQLTNSNIDFIRNNKEIIESIYFLYNLIEKIAKSISPATYSLNINWSIINQYIDLDFGDSNDYIPSVSKYGSADWWTAFWDWGFKVNFPEGDVNIMRVFNLLSSLYNGTDFGSLASIFKSGYTFFDYLINIDNHGTDKVEVLYNIIVKTEADFKNSGIPFTNKIYDIFDQFSLQLEKLQKMSLDGLVLNIIKSTIKDKLGMSLEEIGEKYSNILIKTISILNYAKDILNNTLPFVLPNIIWNYLKTTAKVMINADKNHNGVTIKFQQFLIPKGFSAI